MTQKCIILGLFTYNYSRKLMISFSGCIGTCLCGKQGLSQQYLKSQVVMAAYFLICSFLLHLIIIPNSGAESNANNSAATDVIDEEWWRTSPRICKKSCVVQVWSFGCYTLYFLNGTQ